MLKRLKNKLKCKKGGLKELLYDNIGIFIVGVLIVVTIFATSNQLRSRGTKNETNIDKIQENVVNKTFTEPTGIE